VSDLLSVLSNAASSLGVYRALTATIGHNIQNANTPGYARQRAVLSETSPAEAASGAYIGRGVALQAVTQVRDRFVEAQIPAAIGSAARSAAESEALAALHALDPGAAGGLGASIGGFYAALRGLSQNAGDAGLRTTALGAARSLAHAFNRAAGSIEQTRSALDARLGGLVSEVNTEARAVAELNAEVNAARAAGAEPNDLLDMRQVHLDKLAELVGATQVPTSEGDVNLVLPGGVVLVAGRRAGVLSAAPDPGNGGHLAVSLRAVDGSGPSRLAASSFSGAVAGVLEARDGALASAASAVDQLAFDLAASVNAVHAAGFGLDGVSGRPLFDAGAAAAGAAGRIAAALADPRQLAAASSAAALPGDARNAQALVATESAALSGGKDPQATLSSIISDFGAEAQRSAAYASQDAAIRDNLLHLRESISGVSIDEELVAMQRAQRGFEAITRVIRTADEMLQVLMQLR